MTLQIPEKLDTIIESFDVSSEPLDLNQLENAITIYLNNLPNDEMYEPIKRATCYELAVFKLVPNFSNSNENPWNSYFRPRASYTDNDGASFYSPRIDLVPSSAIALWEQRAHNLRHPVLKARYSDAVWDLSPFITGSMKRNVAMARVAIDAYILAAQHRLDKEIHSAITGAERALDLAILINDSAKIDYARAALLSLHRDAMATPGCYQYLRAFDHLINLKKARSTDEEFLELVTDLEKALTWLSDPRDPSLFNPHAASDVSTRLAGYYKSKNRLDDMRRVHGVTAKAFEFIASQSGPTLASALLQDSINAHLLAGQSKEAERIRVEMQTRIGESQSEMAQFRLPAVMSKDKIKEIVSGIVVEDAAQTLVNIAFAFLPDPDKMAEEVKQLAEVAPLMSSLTQFIVGEDRIAAKVGSVTDDLGGRILMHTLRTFQIHLPLLHETLKASILRHGFTAADITAWVNRKGVISPSKLGLVFSGVSAWLNRDFYKSFHILIPQIESALRMMVEQVGWPTTKPSGRVQGVSVAINMGDILFNPDLEIALGPLGPRLCLYMKVVFADPRGMNLRNEFAHGLMAAEEINEPAMSWIIQALLIIALWQKPESL